MSATELAAKVAELELVTVTTMSFVEPAAVEPAAEFTDADTEAMP